MTAPTITTLDLGEIHLEPSCQARAELDQDVIREYAALYRDPVGGERLPPVEIFWVDDRAVLVDGFHRYAASTKANRGFLRCIEVGRGDLEAAAWYAVGANQAHGLRRSNEDKRKAVIMALQGPNGQRESLRRIAAHVGVDHKTVSRIRAEIESSSAEVGNSPTESEPVGHVGNSPTESGTPQNRGDDRVRGRDGKPYPRQKAGTAQVGNSPTESEPDRGNARATTADDGPGENSSKTPPEQIAQAIQTLRQKIARAFGEHQTIDGHLERALLAHRADGRR